MKTKAPKRIQNRPNATFVQDVPLQVARGGFQNLPRRTFVEGRFGVLKNTSTTGFHRGSHQFVGLPLVTLVVAMAAATTNLRLLRTWHERTGLGDTQHPLLQPDEDFLGASRLTREQAEQLDALLLKKMA